MTTLVRNLIQEIMESEKMDIIQHLKDRGVDLERTRVIVDEKDGFATFFLYNLSGQLVGQQRYNPWGNKKINGRHSNDWDHNARYFFHSRKEGDKHDQRSIAVWGLESVYDTSRILFVVEGIFDAVKVQNAGYPAIAVMTNDPSPLSHWFKALGKTVIAVLDNDPAGKKLRNIAHKFINVPDPYKDLGDMPQEEVNQLLRDFLL